MGGFPVSRVLVAGFYNRGCGPAETFGLFRARFDRRTPCFIPHLSMSQVQEGSFLTLHYRLSGPQGRVVIDTFEQGQPATLSLGAGELSPAIEQRLIGLEEGSTTVIELDAGEAFGERQPEMVQWVARKLLSELGDPHEKYAAGDVVQFPTPDGLGSYAGSAVEVREDGAVLFDFNHPLAGQPVRFEVQLIGVL
jgi:FKBP-type peptidyl-prolyl cis-trans isomerase SlpA